MKCDDCFEGMYPYYGLAPHKHVGVDPGDPRMFIGSTVIDPEPYPDNFSEDQEAKGCGVYTHCLKCGRDHEST